jgi:hypothetical protein
MADKMEVDAVVADKQVEASGPAPEKAPERSTYNTVTPPSSATINC